ncbi:MAG: hypothetical protein WAM30_03930, partial [Candidatus Dormiibacterota bacterium]
MILAVAILMCACQWPWASGDASPTPTPRTVITPKQAEQVFRKLYAERSSYIDALKVDSLPTIASSVALLNEQGYT